MALLPGRSDAPSRLNRTQNHIPVILPLRVYNFRQAPEEFKVKTDIKPKLQMKPNDYDDQLLNLSPHYTS